MFRRKSAIDVDTSQETLCFVWGGSARGQLGTGDHTKAIWTPQQLKKSPISGSKWTVAAIGLNHTVLVHASGSPVVTAGDNTYHQLGRSTPSAAGEASFAPVSFFQDLKLTIDTVAAGDNHSLVLTTDGRLFTWGANQRGQLGHGDKGVRTVPREMDLPPKLLIVQIAAGGDASAFRTRDGDVYVWGTEDKLIPTRVKLPEAAHQIEMGNHHFLALGRSGKLYSWGQSDFFQLGRGTHKAVSVPTLIDTVSKVKFAHVVCGAYFSAAMDTAGTIYTWGMGTATGHGSGEDIKVPTALTNIPKDLRIVKMAAGSTHLVMMASNGQVLSTGSGAQGQLGINKKEGKVPILIEKAFKLNKVYDIFAGPFGNLAFVGRAPAASAVGLPPRHLISGMRHVSKDANKPIATPSGASSNSLRNTIFIGTFNVDSQPPSLQQISQMAPSESPDIAVFGLQEVQTLPGDNLSSLDAYTESIPKDEKGAAWETQLGLMLKTKFPASDHVSLVSVQLLGIFLVVFVKGELQGLLKKVETAHFAVGLFQSVGNKGAVAVRMKLGLTSMCFVNSHLAAHMSEVKKRNEDHHMIVEGMNFPVEDDPHGARSLFDADLVFWFGDLNYRIELPNDVVRGKSAAKDYAELRAKDQLRREQEAGQAFSGMLEGAIDFPPTYKYDRGTSKFDTSSKNRVPAWTDRILFRGSKIREQRYYTSYPAITLSDHKPVASFFTIDHTYSGPSLWTTTSLAVSTNSFRPPSNMRGGTSRRKSPARVRRASRQPSPPAQASSDFVPHIPDPPEASPNMGRKRRSSKGSKGSRGSKGSKGSNRSKGSRKGK